MWHTSNKVIKLEKVVEIDLLEESAFLEKYNKQIVSRELLEYLKNQAAIMNNKDKIKIVIHRKCRMPNNYIEILKNALISEYIYYRKRIHYNNIIQVIFLICGFMLLLLSHGMKKFEVLEEILLISGWVFIWEMIEMELFSDSKNIHNRRIIKKLLKSEIVDDYQKLENIL